jgi:hypothetical protein
VVVRGLQPSPQCSGPLAVGVLSARGSKPFACAVFPDGTLHHSDVTGRRMAARAQVDVMRFSTLGAGSRTNQGWPGSCAAQIDRSMASCSSANSTTQGIPELGGRLALKLPLVTHRAHGDCKQWFAVAQIRL